MVTVNKLTTFAKDNRNKEAYKRLGNHYCKTYDNGKTEFYYHTTAICVLQTDGSRVYNNGGYHTTSTTQAINAYKRYFGDM